MHAGEAVRNILARAPVTREPVGSKPDRPGRMAARHLPGCPWVIVLLLGALASLTTGTAATAQEASPSLAEPGISPDGLEIAFVSGGDVWTVSSRGGEARLLVAHEAQESRPLYSPDGRYLAFTSYRTGDGDLYRLDLASGDLERLTYGASTEMVSGWSRDGAWIYFSSSAQDISGMEDVYRVPVDGGTPMPRLADRYETEFFATPSPDGETLAFSTRGRMASSQWWRNGHSHIDEAEIWLARPGSPPRYRQLSSGEAKEIWPLWSPDGGTVYYVSDRSGSENLWRQPTDGGGAEPVTEFSRGRFLWPSITLDGSTVAFERDFGIWTLDLDSGQAMPVRVSLRGVGQHPAVTYETFNDELDELALSPDGEKVAFAVHGEVFAAPAEDGGRAIRITRTPARESGLTWGPESRRLVYTSRRDVEPQLYLYDFTREAERRLTTGREAVASPVFSPSGEAIAFVVGGDEVRVLELDSGEEGSLARGFFWLPPLTRSRSLAWSPDGEWLAFTAVSGPFSNIHLVPTRGGEARPVSFLANANAGSISWSPDGTFLLFPTSQRTEDGQIARVDLVPRTPEFQEDRFRELFDETEPPGVATPEPAYPAPAPGNPISLSIQEKEDSVPSVEVDFQDIRRRASFLPLGVDANDQIISPDGKWLVVSGSAEGRENLYAFPLDPLADAPRVTRQITSTRGGKGDMQFGPDGQDVYYLEGGRIRIVDVDGGDTRSLSVTAEMEVDFRAEKEEVFDEAWSFMRDHFYDADFHGSDWETVRETFRPQVAGARDPHELHRLLNLMLGELNASHLGNRASRGSSGPSSAYLGLRFDPEAYELMGRMKITEIVPLGPVDVTGEVAVGDHLLAVDGQDVREGMNLQSLLLGREGERVELRVSREPEGGEIRTVAVKPVSLGQEKGLVYREWVESRRDYVDQVSGGRLGYVHMPDMGWGSLQQLYLDLDAENRTREGVVVDLRNNNGGFVNVYAIDVFARMGYLRMTIRGGPTTPARTTLGQRALEKPTILVVNQHTLSDGEDFTEGYRELELGTVVGEPTAGWIIYTWGTSLIDDSYLRLPRTRVVDNRGQTMELNPRPVDITVERPAGESYRGADSQLETAVRELLRQIDQGRQNE